MHIIDNCGKLIEVTDLSAAIVQAELFKGFHHEDAAPLSADKERMAYWTDIHAKLLELQSVYNADNPTIKKQKL